MWPEWWEKELSFGDRLREFRDRRGVSQQIVADILGMDRSTYAYYESGKTEPSINTLIMLADFYGVTLDYLIGHAPPKANKD